MVPDCVHGVPVAGALGANPAALIDAINRVQEERDAARAELANLPATRTVTRAEVDAMIDYLGDIGQELSRAEPVRLQALYEALGVEMTYDAQGRWST